VLLVGTSGFSYKDWVGSFYPEGTAAADMFGFYQENFDTVEIDYTYYSFPSSRTMASMAARAKDGFLFSVRTHKSITHDRAASTEDVRKAASDFRAALAPMYDSGKLACVLIQYPWSFRMNPENVDRMLIAAERFGGLKVAVEFRNDSWANERMMKLLCDNRLALCCVESCPGSSRHWRLPRRISPTSGSMVGTPEIGGARNRAVTGMIMNTRRMSSTSGCPGSRKWPGRSAIRTYT